MRAIGIEASVATLLAEERLRMVYQPIVELADGNLVAYEALVRGPRGTALAAPDELFAAAGREGLYAELDRACRKLAIEEAERAGLDPSLLLFLNVEPGALDDGGVLAHPDERAGEGAGVVVELTERALASRPREVLAAVRWLRQRGCRIALDDIGVDVRSLALMPFVAPDVIKLDRSLVQDRLPALEAARIINVVGAEAERSGALVLAEGIETPAHLERARAMGATLGQGWYLGEPDRLADPSRPCRALEVPRRRAFDDEGRTPFETIAAERPIRRGDKRLLLSISRQLEEEAFGLADEAVILATFQDVAFFSDRTAGRYRCLADQAALVGALGAGMPRRPGGKVRGADLAADDPLCGEWDVIVVAPHFAGAFVARDLGDHGVDSERRFDHAITYDRELVTRAARRLLARIIPTR